MKKLHLQKLHLLECLCLFTFTMLAQLAYAQAVSDPQQRQSSGIALIDRWMSYVRRTGDTTGALSDLTTANNELKASFDLFLQRNDFAGASWSAIKLADILRYTNRWSEAVPIYQSAIKLAAQANRTDYQTKALARLALSGMQSGQIDAAQKDGREAVRLGANCGNKDFYFDALDVAAEIEVKRGNLLAAGEYLGRAFAMSTEIEDRQQLYLAYSDRGDVYEKFAEKCDYQHDLDVCYQLLDLSQTSYQKALAIAQEMGYKFFSRQMRGFLTELHRRKQFQRSQQNSQAFALSTFNPQTPKDVLVNQHFTTGAANPDTIALTEGEVKQITDQQAGKQQQGLVAKNLDPSRIQVQLAKTKGNLAEMKGNDNEALAKYMQVVDLLEQERRKLRDEQARAAFMEDKIDNYNRPALLQLSRKQYPEAFAFLEGARSRALADMIASRSLNLATLRERQLFSELQMLKAKVEAKQQRLFNLTASQRSDQQTPEIVSLENGITDLQQQVQNLEMGIGKEAPKLKELTSSEPVTLESVQRSAAAGGYDMLYYVVTEADLIVWHINGTGVHIENVFLPHSELIKKAAALQNSLIAAKHAPAATFDDRMSRQLFLYVIQPVLTYITSSHLVIIPQEELTSIPYQALLNPETGKYLGESYAISYAPSATVLATLETKPNLRDGQLLAVADPAISAASAEVEAIGQFYPGRSKVVSKDPSTKTEVEGWVGNYNLIHLSVHGKFNASDPLLSYLELKPEPPDTGHLTAYEMFGLRLPKNSLVVLSACETGKVKETHGSEALGMVRSLLYAGAGTLVLSSWEVNAASTQLWMETFYREGQSKPPAEAARLALVAVKSRPEYSHPFYWAPFVITGK